MTSSRQPRIFSSQDQLTINFNSIYIFYFPLTCNLTYSQIMGIRIWALWGVHYLPTIVTIRSFFFSKKEVDFILLPKFSLKKRKQLFASGEKPTKFLWYWWGIWECQELWKFWDFTQFTKLQLICHCFINAGRKHVNPRRERTVYYSQQW